MQVLDEAPNKPNFAMVAVLFAATILFAAVAATLIVSWRAKQAKKTPYTKHPVATVVPVTSYPSQVRAA